MKATMSIDPSLIKMLGRKLYSTHSIPIIVRELLQNSVDACKRQGVKPEISITVLVDRGQQATVICKDNGCGMTEDELLNDFLCLGGSSKRGTDSTGKFGIAKAAIMSGDYWEVHTLDNYITVTDLEEGKDIHKVSYIQGTIIKVVLEAGSEWNYFTNLLSMIYLSDVDIHFIYTRTGSETIDDEHAGFNSDMKTLIISEDKWQGKAFTNFEEAPLLKTLSNKAFVRLNNLVQFQVYSYRLPEGIFIIDVDNIACDPSNEDYPFTMSREEVVGNMKFSIRKWLNDVSENPLTVKYGMEQEDLDVSIVPGRLCKGKRKYTMSGSIEAEEEMVINWEHEIREHIKYSNKDSIAPYINENTNGFLLKLYDYKETDDETIAQDAKVLSVWRKLLEIILPDGFDFGLGLIGVDYVRASHERDKGISFFACNPSLIRSLGTKKEMVTRLWISACHETAHITHQSHDELFVGMMSTLMEETSLAFITSLQHFEKELGIQ